MNPFAFQAVNSDLLDTLDSTQFLRSDVDDVVNGSLNLKIQ